ncbi:UDP-glucose 6-dehydrogenase [Phyllostomus discolor]|uniref:UDP-glucose 6-dehydrogenase n=1 Tax=Phyllostomus discolor TaxID=89673 RepID=A0A834EXW7_9CHIR|nr:UDP-glucose 6-dehydrogenase [Phyllostomus discolor]
MKSPPSPAEGLKYGPGTLGTGERKSGGVAAVGHRGRSCRSPRNRSGSLEYNHV